MRHRSLGVLFVVIAATGCTRSGGSGADAERPAAATSSAAMSAAPAGSTPPSSSTAAPSGPCASLAPTACVLRAGCFLDQPALGKLTCRDAANACERAVRHGDLIGSSVPGVTEEASAAAERTCNATAGCAVAGGKCSCPCAIFGHCNCGCGGGYLRRCTTTDAARSLADYPPRR